jgi:peptide/nickel transport system ATP-binding protein
VSGWADGDLVLQASGVCVEYAGPRPTRAVRDVTIELRRGEVLGIAGESGCGKTTLAYALTRMLKPPAGLTGGSITFFPRDGGAVDIMSLNPDDLRSLRWNKIAMVFQSAMNALNPVSSLARQFDDIFKAHRPQMSRAERRERSRELLDMVGIDPGRVHGFAHELSGGMRQRVMIAMALALEPEIVIMDEPTTALDVVVQREILDEIERLRSQLGFSIIFITHDLSLLLEISDRLAVMYAGEVVEYAPSIQIAIAPAHPYTLGLLRSFPDMRGARRELRGVPGSPPDLRDDFPGCPFQPRCDYRFDPCADVHPALTDVTASVAARSNGAADRGERYAACHLHDPVRKPDGPPAELSGTRADPATADAPATPATSATSATPATPDAPVADHAITADSSGGER